MESIKVQTYTIVGFVIMTVSNGPLSFMLKGFNCTMYSNDCTIEVTVYMLSTL